MLKFRGDKYKSLEDLQVSYKDSIQLGPIKKGEKITILSDSMLKTMFQNENRIKYSAKLISYYLDISFEKLLENIHLSKNELDKNKENSKGEKCDYIAFIDGTSINIEVNNNGSIHILERNMEYAHRLYSRLIKKSVTENEYTQVIQFNLNNFSFVGNDKIVDKYVIQNDDHLKLSNKLIFIQIFIPNLVRKWYTLGIQKLDESEKFLLMMVLRKIDDSKKIGEGVKIMEEYINEAEEVLLDEDLRESYDKEWALKDLGMQQGYIDGYEIGQTKGIEKGRAEGIEKGRAEGIEKGRAEGIEKGRVEGIETIAKKMLEKNKTIKEISEITNLTKKEIESLR